jgi:hypothetical protein
MRSQANKKTSHHPEKKEKKEAPNRLKIDVPARLGAGKARHS